MSRPTFLGGGGGLCMKIVVEIWGFVAANIDIYLVWEKWYFPLQLRLGPTDLHMVVPRNDAIFPKLTY
jgi:hypothetical protein